LPGPPTTECINEGWATHHRLSDFPIAHTAGTMVFNEPFEMSGRPRASGADQFGRVTRVNCRLALVCVLIYVLHCDPLPGRFPGMFLSSA
jgi:hypothetical protein